jgi:hypothetical protein
MDRLSLPAQEGAERASFGDVTSEVIRSEPPGTDPYAGWCGGRRLITTGYPIRRFGFFQDEVLWVISIHE